MDGLVLSHRQQILTRPFFVRTLTIMNITDACSALEQQLNSEIASDPLHALAEIDQARQLIDVQQRHAGREPRCSTTHGPKIGEAMGGDQASRPSEVRTSLGRRDQGRSEGNQRAREGRTP